MKKEACVKINVGEKKHAPTVKPPVTVMPKPSTGWAPVVMSILAGVGLAVVGLMLWPKE